MCSEPKQFVRLREQQVCACVFMQPLTATTDPHGCELHVSNIKFKFQTSISWFDCTQADKRARLRAKERERKATEAERKAAEEERKAAEAKAAAEAIDREIAQAAAEAAALSARWVLSVSLAVAASDRASKRRTWQVR